MINAFFQKVAEKALMTLDRRVDMGRKCIESAMRYDWDRMVELTESFYENLE